MLVGGLTEEPHLHIPDTQVAQVWLLVRLSTGTHRLASPELPLLSVPAGWQDTLSLVLSVAFSSVVKDSLTRVGYKSLGWLGGGGDLQGGRAKFKEAGASGTHNLPKEETPRVHPP